LQNPSLAFKALSCVGAHREAITEKRDLVTWLFGICLLGMIGSPPLPAVGAVCWSPHQRRSSCTQWRGSPAASPAGAEGCHRPKGSYYTPQKGIQTFKNI